MLIDRLEEGHVFVNRRFAFLPSNRKDQEQKRKSDNDQNSSDDPFQRKNGASDLDQS